MKECPWWGWSFIIKATQSWNLTSTYSELLAKIHNTYTTTYNFNWPVPRMHASERFASTYVHKSAFISSIGSCRVLKTRMHASTGPYHTYKYVRSTRFFLVEYVKLMCSRIRIHVRIASPYVYKYVLLQLVCATCSKHACILQLVRTIHTSTYAVLSSS